MSYYFIRVNIDTIHNNPNMPEAYVVNEPPKFPETKYNYAKFCLKNNIIRIGWPDVGDIIKGNKVGALANAYSLDTLKTSIQKALIKFSKIQLGDIILMPDKDISGNLYMGVVYKTYEYYHNIPSDPYDCAHRLGVIWDLQSDGEPFIYSAKSMDISTLGGWWRSPFAEIKNSETIHRIDNCRQLNKPEKIKKLDSYEEEFTNKVISSLGLSNSVRKNRLLKGKGVRKRGQIYFTGKRKTAGA